METIACELQRFWSTPVTVGDSALDSAAILPDQMRDAMLDGYRYVGMHTPRERWLMPGHSQQILEVNNIVLFGLDRHVRRSHRRALKHTERRFYETRGSGIGHLVEWYATNRHHSIWQIAAGLYIQVLGNPQLFVEGNHRSAALIMSRVLLESGNPPFVLTRELADDWLALTKTIPSLQRHGLRARIKTQPIRNALAALLEGSLDKRFLK